MTSDFTVCLDACVLANPGVNDLLLRLADHRLYLPCFSETILAEVRHVHKDVFGWNDERTEYWQEQVKAAFPEALVENYEALIPSCTNDEDDRHVLATAIRGGAQLIVTFNLKHFRTHDLEPRDLRAVHHQDYLITLWDMHPAVVLQRLHDISERFSQNLENTLDRLEKSVPMFAAHVRNEIE